MRYVAGRQAILTIRNQDGQEVEKVTLHTLKDKAAMHAMMLEKGFVKKSEAEIQAITTAANQAKEEEKAAMAARRMKMFSGKQRSTTQQQAQDILSLAVDTTPNYSAMILFSVLGVAGVVGMGVVVVMRRRNERRRLTGVIAGRV